MKNIKQDNREIKIKELKQRKKEIEKVLYNPINRRNNGKPVAEVAHLQVERAKIQFEIRNLLVIR